MNPASSPSPLRVSLVRSADDSYDIHVGAGLLGALRPLLPALPRQVAVVSDSNVHALYGAALRAGLEAAGFAVAVEAVFPAGEQHKTRDTKARVEDHLLEAKLGRDAWIAALGGGVTGDLAGYTAATYLRGIPFVQFPTTLLAMVDSSVGGKTGVDTPHGKNLVGAFWQPRAVVADVSVLRTLPAEQVRAGLAEVIKHGVIADATFFARLEREWDAVAAGHGDVVASIVRANCAIKAAVVERDERESDLRKILNFGHTLGHAVETAADYALLHGDCVAIGMRYEARLAVRLGLLAEADGARLERLLDRAGFAPADTLAATNEALVALTRQDKKARDGHVEYVFPSRLGAMASGERGFGIRVADADVLAVLQDARRR
jgi:3-dehydroquinate synthase